MDWLDRNKRLVLAGVLGFVAWFLAAYLVWLPQSLIWPELAARAAPIADNPHLYGACWLATGTFAALASGCIAGLLSKRPAIPTGLAVALPLAALLVLMMATAGIGLSTPFGWYRIALVAVVAPAAIAGAFVIRRS